MRSLFTVSVGLICGVMTSLLLLRAGFPPALAALVFWMIAGGIGLSLMQFAFLGKLVQDSARAAEAAPLRAFLLGFLLLEVPFLVFSTLRLMGAREPAALALVAAFGGLVLVFWPANVSLQIGRRLLPEEPRVKQVTAGSVVAATALFIPVLGWLWLLFLAARGAGGLCLRGRHA